MFLVHHDKDEKVPLARKFNRFVQEIPQPGFRLQHRWLAPERRTAALKVNDGKPVAHQQAPQRLFAELPDVFVREQGVPALSLQDERDYTPEATRSNKKDAAWAEDSLDRTQEGAGFMNMFENLVDHDRIITIIVDFSTVLKRAVKKRGAPPS